MAHLWNSGPLRIDEIIIVIVYFLDLVTFLGNKKTLRKQKAREPSNLWNITYLCGSWSDQSLLMRSCTISVSTSSTLCLSLSQAAGNWKDICSKVISCFEPSYVSFFFFFLFRNVFRYFYMSHGWVLTSLDPRGNLEMVPFSPIQVQALEGRTYLYPHLPFSGAYECPEPLKIEIFS